MKNVFIIALVAVFFIFVGSSCSKESESFQGNTTPDFYPLQVGKMYLYRLDSVVPFNFGESLKTKSYQAKDTVESTFTDNQGRLSYRIFRFLRDTSGQQPWQYSNTFFATPTPTSIEYVENNFRFIRLSAPVRDGKTWAGNAFIETKNDNTYLDGWEYEYQDLNTPYSVQGKTYDSTVSILQQDELTPDGIEDFTLGYLQKNYSKEVFAKGIGLIYKDFIHWTWQRPQNQDGSFGKGKFEDGAVGIRLSLISHN